MVKARFPPQTLKFQTVVSAAVTGAPVANSSATRTLTTRITRSFHLIAGIVTDFVVTRNIRLKKAEGATWTYVYFIRYL